MLGTGYMAQWPHDRLPSYFSFNILLVTLPFGSIDNSIGVEIPGNTIKQSLASCTQVMQGGGPYHEPTMKPEHIESAFAVAGQRLDMYNVYQWGRSVLEPRQPREATGTASSTVERATIASCVVCKHRATIISHI
jgi:hypothetical protein